ncbi:cyclic nucleotide-binding domain-containing protein [Chryseobacterium sp. AG363]|uniref:cyclic nucleotide-binding domain-containing protein n=1 Tax=Chryseobacterium sp. AG363 TaxID=2183997 RepID=UPI000E74CDDB|nr:cyclic nucleotide-binding domain-containing protein [Chryseobacterium sp. AG363]RKE81580.1 cyclic nucleotide-binding protein [Chryseobacterium sp. AG363]
MITDENVLLQLGAFYEHYPAKEIIFQNGDIPHFFIQICSGTVELNNYHDDGREFTLNILSEGDSIGESLLFGDKNYPMNAVAKTDCTVIKLAKSSFLELVNSNREISSQLLEHLSDRLYYKYTMLFNRYSE